MTRRTLAAAAVAVVAVTAAPGAPAGAVEAVPAVPAAVFPRNEPDLAIRAVTVRPAEPVVGPTGSVRLVVDVAARGADRVDVTLEPGRPESDEGEEPDGPSGPGQDGWGDDEPGQAGGQESGSASPLQPGAGPADGAPGGPEDEGTGDGADDPGGLGPVMTTPVPRLLGVPLAGRRSPSGWAARAVRVPVRAGAAGSGGWETWRFLPQRRLSRRYPSGAWTVTATARNGRGGELAEKTVFYLRRATEIDGARVVRDGRAGVRVSGTLLRVDPLGRVDYRPFPGQRVRLWFRPSGAGEWQPAGSAVTRRDGWFSARARGRVAGVWRAEYPGTTRYARSTSQEKRL
ncbi:hypothetical protein JOL79_07325 [Microbispora sp. RL4-1S]|uniref:Uncharacterized protein n=1 Tax=Microbispora oryzae TaxID=2806554 RepID=A0A940WDL2_9ACTN|nr:hypothetical protein [Microbispora oryzae]MBP2703609.1 hypothetical protein [Microbispora oryzae]